MCWKWILFFNKTRNGLARTHSSRALPRCCGHLDLDHMIKRTCLLEACDHSLGTESQLCHCAAVGDLCVFSNSSGALWHSNVSVYCASWCNSTVWHTFFFLSITESTTWNLICLMVLLVFFLDPFSHTFSWSSALLSGRCVSSIYTKHLQRHSFSVH